MPTSDKERVIGEFETRKIGNSIVLTVPQKVGIPEKTKYLLVAKPDGSLEYKPVENNPWLNGKFDDIDFGAEIAKLDDIDTGVAVGKESVQW